MSEPVHRTGHHEVARALHRRIGRTVAGADRGVELATITALDPLTVELHSGATTLTEVDDFDLTQTLNWWRLNYGLAVGDILVLLRTAEGWWLAIDAHSDRLFEGGVRMSRPAATPIADVRDFETKSETAIFSVDQPTGNVTWHHHIVKAAPAYDKAGNFIGYVPIFASLPS